MFPTNANVRMNHPTLVDGRQCWNGIVQSTRISSWKTELGNVNYLTLNADSKYSILSWARYVNFSDNPFSLIRHGNELSTNGPADGRLW